MDLHEGTRPGIRVLEIDKSSPNGRQDFHPKIVEVVLTWQIMNEHSKSPAEANISVESQHNAVAWLILYSPTVCCTVTCCSAGKE